MAFVVPQGLLQQFPVPETPQIPEMQSSSSLQLPAAIGLTQTPALQTKPLAQSAAEAHDVRQPPSAVQPRLPAHAVPMPAGPHAPMPSQAIGPTVPSLQKVPGHAVPALG